jgi:hypothetical protein
MDNTRRTDVGYTYWTVSRDMGMSKSFDDIVYHIQKHGYSAGDGSTFIIMDVGVLPNSYPDYVLPQYGRIEEIALVNTMERGGLNYTLIDVSLDIVDMTKYKIDKSGRVLIDDVVTDVSQRDAAIIKGIQYNRGDTINTFRKLTSFILSRYDMNNIGMVSCSVPGYSVRSVKGGREETLYGIILFSA